MANAKRTPALPPDLPGFTFERHLGSGGFSDVYLYEQHLPRRKVAVKVLLGGDELGDTSREAFIGEANVMAQMSSHPYIVTIFHADVANDGRPYFVMEYAPGRSLSDRFRTERIPVDEVLRTGVRIASAVATAHAAGVLHRDIKPANILTNAFGWPALTDFGISSAVDDDLADAVDGTRRGGAGAGLSVPWSSPEMFDDDPQPDVRSEVFSLGATIFTLVAGHTPFEIPGSKNGAIDLIGRIERGDIVSIDRPDVPRALISVLHKAMSRRPEYRYATVVEFARALQRVELELGYAATAIDVPNLHVEAPVREEADADATSLRSMHVIGAQAPGATPIRLSSGARGGNAQVPAGATVTRAPLRDAGALAPAVVPERMRHDEAHPSPGGRQGPIVATPVLERHPDQIEWPADAGDTHADAKRPENRNVIVGIASGAVVLLLVALSIVGWMLFPRDDEAGSTPGGDDAVVSPVPPGDFPRTPTSPTATRSEDGIITFTWMNPDEQPGDVYFWTPTDGSTQGTTTSDNSATVGPHPAGAKVCIEVETRRAGKVSPMPLTTCYLP